MATAEASAAQPRAAAPKKHADAPAVAASTRSRQLASLLSGGVAGTLASTLTMPLEVVKTQLQTGARPAVPLASVLPKQQGAVSGMVQATSIARNIATHEGIRGFFRGFLPTVVGILPARSTYFWAYDLSKTSLSAAGWRSDSSVVHMISAVAAGGVSNTITNPIWMVKTRMQLQAGMADGYKGYPDAVARIVREEGIGGFFRGLTASYWGISESVLHFVVYERIKSFFAAQNPQGDQRLENYQYLTAAAASKFIASSITYPHEVVRTRMREQPEVGQSPKYRFMVQSLKLIAREEGRRGLYAGMGAHLLRVVPNTAVMFLTYERVMRWIEASETSRPDEVENVESSTAGKQARSKVNQ